MITSTSLPVVVTLSLLLFALSVSGHPKPPKIALNFENAFDLTTATLMYGDNYTDPSNYTQNVAEGYGFFSYEKIAGAVIADVVMDGGGRKNSFDFIVTPNTINNHSYLYILGYPDNHNLTCQNLGRINWTYADEYLKWEVPKDAMFMGYSSCDKYNCSGWAYNKTIDGSNWFVNEFVTVEHHVPAVVNVFATFSFLVNYSGDVFPVVFEIFVNYYATGITVGEIPPRVYEKPEICQYKNSSRIDISKHHRRQPMNAKEHLDQKAHFFKQFKHVERNTRAPPLNRFLFPGSELFPRP